MASISDVETALRNAVVATLYAVPGTPPSLLGYPIKVYAGWPDAGTLDVDLVETAPDHPTAAHVSIYPMPTERNVTRYARDRKPGSLPSATYTLAVAGQVVTVGGAAPSTYFAQNLAIFINGAPYVVTATTGQTPAQLATALRALIVVDVPGTTVSGTQVTLPAGARIGALRVGVTAAVLREVRRQEKPVQIIISTSSPVSRAAISDLIDPVLAATDFLALSDGSMARLIYRSSREDDFAQKQRVYRRTLTYTAEYPTLLTESATQIVAGKQNLEDAQGVLIATSNA